MFSKYEFYQDMIQYLGHAIFYEGISVDLKKVKAILEWLVPKDVLEVRSSMGIIGYYCRFIEGFSKLAYPITSLQKKGI